MNSRRTFALKAFPREFLALKFLLTIFAAVLALAGTIANAQTITSIRDFGSETGDPLNPQVVGMITQGEDGDMYSTTPAGGANGLGAAFKINPEGSVTILHSFAAKDGTPFSGLNLGSDGHFYGTTCNGGLHNEGSVFKMTSAGVITVLYSFTGGNDGKCPQAPPVEGVDGKYYGTTSAGGLSGAGTVYKVTSGGSLTTIFAFDVTDGFHPEGALVQAGDGNFYGTTNQGNDNCGNDNICGTIFKITPSGTFTLLHSFPFNPFFNTIFVSGLALSHEGDLYGTTVQSGTGHGEVFKIGRSGGTLTDIHDFTAGTDGANPSAGLMLANNGNFYGVTAASGANGFGSLYEVSSADKFSVLPPAFNGIDGAFPSVRLFQNTDGIVYGAAFQGGAVTNTGTFFKITGLPDEKPFVSLLSATGTVNTKVGILGQNLNEATSVSFNGVKATFTAVSGTFLTAVVPAGASTGNVTVTTPTGVLTSNRKFTVTGSSSAATDDDGGILGDAKFVPLEIEGFTPASGSAGTQVQISGLQLALTDTVRFNGVPATRVTINSNSLITATVPANATTGKITITYSHGTAASASAFVITN